MDILPATQSTSRNNAEQSGARLADDLQSFLTILTTQLKHQDPLEPLSSSEFTSQLAQFAGVEQTIQTNANLERLLAFQATNQALGAVGYIGKMVTASGNEAVLKDGAARFAYSLPQQAASTAIGITSEAGVPILIQPGKTGMGRHDFVWDGRDSQGVPQPEGTYRLTATALDADGKPITVKTYTIGIATGVDSSEGKITIMIDGKPVPLSDVVAVEKALEG